MAPVEYIHIVTRHTFHGMGENQTEIRGTYWNLEEANAAVRVDLTKDWERDFFEEWEEEVVEGKLSIQATCPEGETMTVDIKTVPAPTTKKRSGASPTPQPKSSLSPVVWIITETRFEHHTDKKGHSKVASNHAFDNLEDANQAAQSILAKTWGVEDFELHEENAGSTTKPYDAWAYVHTDRCDHYRIQVKKLSVQTRQPSPPTETSAKRKLPSKETGKTKRQKKD